MRILFALGILLCACGSSSSGDDSSAGGTASGGAGGTASGGAASGGAASGSCPSIAGTWTITAHCVSSFVGQTVSVTQSACMLSFAAPFSGYSGTVDSAGKLAVSGPTANGTQDCTGSSSAKSLELACPGPCAVTLTR